MNTTTTDPRAHAIIEGKALDLLGHGATRISVKKLMEDVRAEYRLTINNSDSTPISDRLIEDHPQLAPLIERRARGTRGANKVKAVKTFTLDEVKAMARRSYQLGVKHGIAQREAGVA